MPCRLGRLIDIRSTHMWDTTFFRRRLASRKIWVMRSTQINNPLNSATNNQSNLVRLQFPSSWTQIWIDFKNVIQKQTRANEKGLTLNERPFESKITREKTIPLFLSPKFNQVRKLQNIRKTIVKIHRVTHKQDLCYRRNSNFTKRIYRWCAYYKPYHPASLPKEIYEEN